LIDSKHGSAIKAVRDSEIAAKTSGVDVTGYKLLTFVIAAFFAGIAGVVYGNSVSLIRNTTFDFNYSIKILVRVVLGGMGNITGSMIAAAALTYLDVTLSVNLPGNLAAIKNLVYALILIVAVMWNNAPALKGIRGKYNLKVFFGWVKEKLFKGKSKEQEQEICDWDRVPTKVNMDVILSTDLQGNARYESDPEQPSKGGTTNE
ncbi:MAG: branched-chain amino acid ABC transporter permease, partial [Clostridia bacterium]|nr:branched-chain amino acid ABC transporter permease [Clostridia bacterium]